jgi:hypothetical protein
LECESERKQRLGFGADCDRTTVAKGYRLWLLDRSAACSKATKDNLTDCEWDLRFRKIPVLTQCTGILAVSDQFEVKPNTTAPEYVLQAGALSVSAVSSSALLGALAMLAVLVTV